MNEGFFAALDILRHVAKKQGLTEVEVDDTSFDVEEGVWRCCDYWGVKHETQVVRALNVGWEKQARYLEGIGMSE